MDLAAAFPVQEKQTRKENILVNNRNSLKKTIKMSKFTALTTKGYTFSLICGKSNYEIKAFNKEFQKSFPLSDMCISRFGGLP